MSTEFIIARMLLNKNMIVFGLGTHHGISSLIASIQVLLKEIYSFCIAATSVL